MVRQAQLFDEATLRALLDRGVAQAIESKVTSGQRMRVDTTVVEANISHPTDSGLCADAVTVLSRAARRLQAAGVRTKGGFVAAHRSVQRRLFEIAQAVRLRGDKAKDAIKKPYRRLLRVTKRVIGQAERLARSARRKLAQMKEAPRKAALRALAQIKKILPRANQVVKQTRQRVLRGVTDSQGKIISIFEPHAQILRRGKPHKPTEFGMLTKVQEADGGIVTDVALVPDKADAPLLVPAVEKHRVLGPSACDHRRTLGTHRKWWPPIEDSTRAMGSGALPNSESSDQ